MIGSYLNVMLYTLELVEAYMYFFASPRSLKDPIFLKCCVATSLVSDTVGTIGVCALTFVVSAPKCYDIFCLTCLKSSLVFTGMLLISIDWPLNTESNGRKIPSRRGNSIGPSRCTSPAIQSVRLYSSVTWFIVTGNCESELAPFLIVNVLILNSSRSRNYVVSTFISLLILAAVCLSLSLSLSQAALTILVDPFLSLEQA